MTHKTSQKYLQYFNNELTMRYLNARKRQNTDSNMKYLSIN